MTEQLSFMDLPLEILNQINGELSMIDALAFQCATGNYTNMNLKEITDKFLNLSLDGHDSEYRKAHIRKLFLTIKDYNSNLNNIIPLKVRFGYDIKDALIFLETILDLEDSYDLHFIFKEMNHHDSIFLNNFRYVDLVTSLTILKYKEEDNQEQQPQQHQQFELDNLSKLIKLEIVASNTRINLSPLLNSTLTQLKINNYIHDNWLTEQVSLDDLKITISPDKSFSIAVLPPNLTSLEIISEGSNNNVQIVDYNDWPANIKTLKLRECEKFKSTLFNLHQLNYPYTLDSFSFDGHMHIDIIHKLPSTLTKLVLINKFNIHDEIDDSDFKFASELISLTLTNFSLNFSRCKFKFPPKLTEYYTDEYVSRFFTKLYGKLPIELKIRILGDLEVENILVFQSFINDDEIKYLPIKSITKKKLNYKIDCRNRNGINYETLMGFLEYRKSIIIPVSINFLMGKHFDVSLIPKLNRFKRNIEFELSFDELTYSTCEELTKFWYSKSVTELKIPIITSDELPKELDFTNYTNLKTLQFVSINTSLTLRLSESAFQTIIDLQIDYFRDGDFINKFINLKCLFVHLQDGSILKIRDIGPKT
ncbi:hypothetical protein DFJ63DRAFT_335639 [Scheffersomyces coipomensis]|uniref:uncharacterized protein n=1 Tax=Scheffersomyces coipomensis TaxID=1788519 RepID=UPI00315C6ED9